MSDSVYSALGIYFNREIKDDMVSSYKNSYLIIGGNSVIGRSLINILEQSNRKFFYTSRRKNKYGVNCLFLDLSDNIDGWDPPKDLKAVFFCAAITSMEFCEKNINTSRVVNVVNTIKIIKKLSKLKTPVIFLSSSQVFDGSSACPDENTFTSPQTEYGRQKMQVEEIIRTIDINHSIVRITKVVHNNYNLFYDWILSLKQGVSIYAFSDYFFSPVSINFLGKILIQIADSEKGGIWHISGNKKISYYDAALLIAKSVGASINLVNSTTASSKLKNFYLTSSTVLKCDRIKSCFGIGTPDVVETIKSLFKAPAEQLNL